MTMPSSGEIKISQIMTEMDDDTEPFSLAYASSGIYDTINLWNLNENKPDTDQPHHMSEWYKYEHTGTVYTNPGTISVGSGSSSGTINVYTAQFSTWYAGESCSWVSLSGNSGATGDGSFSYAVTANSDCSRSCTITVTLAVGTLGGGVGDSNTSTTRTTTISQSAGSGCGGGGGGGGGGRGGGMP